LPLDAIRREFDVNVFGAVSVVNAFLPALRKARGRIVQVSRSCTGSTFWDDDLERVKGIEPSYEAWEAAVLPLNYTREPRQL
jgi:NAD(P)-dependent dehydrogenase (short-subunit alcohol dehydrogenase family)